MEPLNHFLSCRSYGTRPFYQEKDFETRYTAIIDKILNDDIPFFLPNISENSLRVIQAIIDTPADSPTPRIQVASLCSGWGIGAEKLYQLLFVMGSVGLLKIVKYLNDTKARNIDARILFAGPCAYRVSNVNQETGREAYTVYCFSGAGYRMNTMKDEKKGDYVVTKNHVS